MVPTIVLITGHPATGKTTLAHHLTQGLHLPLIWKDQIKETLLDLLGSSTKEWSRKLSAVAWALLYQQVENLIKTDISHIVESNFDPLCANWHWQSLSQKYKFQLIQVRCETEPETLPKRRFVDSGNQRFCSSETRGLKVNSRWAFSFFC